MSDNDERDMSVEEAVGSADVPQPQPEATSEVRPGMSQDDTDAAVEQGALGTDPEWGPLGLDENEDAVVRGAGDSNADPLVSALVQALRSGNAYDAENALAQAEAAGYNVSGDQSSNDIQGKRDLAQLAADAEAEAEDADEA